ncbi:MAG: hypothetical protein QXY62_01710 [Candidatus Altiarchaeota archaeon]
MIKKDKKTKLKEENKEGVLNFVFFIISASLFLVSCTSAKLSGTLVGEKWIYYICEIFCVILWIAGAISALIILISAISYITSQSPEQSNENKKRVAFAIISLIFILISPVLVNFFVTPFLPKFECSCINTYNITIKNNETTTTTPGTISVRIIEPKDNMEYEFESVIYFNCEIFGAEYPVKFKWTSNVNGDIGNTQAFAYDKLSRAQHIITLEAVDIKGRKASGAVTIMVIIPKPE